MSDASDTATECRFFAAFVFIAVLGVLIYLQSQAIEKLATSIMAQSGAVSKLAKKVQSLEAQIAEMESSNDD